MNTKDPLNHFLEMMDDAFRKIKQDLIKLLPVLSLISGILSLISILLFRSLSPFAPIGTFLLIYYFEKEATKKPLYMIGFLGSLASYLLFFFVL